MTGSKNKMKISTLVNSVFLLIVCVLGIAVLSPYIMVGEWMALFISLVLILTTFAAMIYASARIEKMNRELEHKIADLNEEKKTIEELLEKNIDLESSISSLISLFVSLEDVDLAINGTLQKICMLCTARRSYLVMLAKDNTFHISHKWDQDGASEQKVLFENLGRSGFPWTMDQINNRSQALLLEVSTLPRSASREKEIMQARGTDHLLIVPIETDENVTYFIAAEDPSFSGTSFKEQLPVLKIVSELIGMAIQHRSFLGELSLFENLIDGSNDHIFVIDRSMGTMIYANETACSELGYSRDELCSMDRDRMIHMFGGSFWEEELVDICGSRFLYMDRSIVKKDSSQVPVEMNVTFTTHENNNYALAIVRDITKRKEVEEVLRKTQERVELALKGADLGMWDWNIRTNELIYNERWVQMLGYENTNIKAVFNSWATMIHPDDMPLFMRAVELHIDNRTPSFEAEFRMRDQDDSWRWILARGKLIEYDSENRPLRFTGTTMDISQRKHVEEELRRSNELKDLFTDILRHDLLNPAGNIKGYSDLLYDLEPDEKTRMIADGIGRNIERLIGMIEAAAKFAKFESADEIELIVMDIGPVIRDLAEQFNQKIEQKNMRLDILAKGSYHTLANPVVEEIFANFISNAIKYSPDGSCVTVDVIASDHTWKVVVADEGEGIPDELKTYVFDRFKRLHKKGIKGTGLGLAIVKRIAEIMQAKVGVDNNPSGRGSVFWVEFKRYYE